MKAIQILGSKNQVIAVLRVKAMKVAKVEKQEVKKFAKGQVVTTRSIGDSDCIFSVEVISRTEKTCTVKVKGDKQPKRCKIHVWDNAERIYALGQYSMCPIFTAK